MSEQQSRSRAEFLKADYAETFRLAGIMVDWRATSVWALLTGLTALAGAIAIAHPVAWFGFAVVIGASIVFAVSRRRLARTAGERLVALASEVHPDAEWDRTGMADVPFQCLYPEDVASPADLERLLRMPPEDARAQRKSDSRSVHVAVYLDIALMAVALVFSLSTFSSIFLMFSDDSERARSSAVAITVIATLSTASAASLEVFRYVAYSRRVSQAIVPLAVAELPRLWAIDNSFDGQVVRLTPSGYVLDVTKMSVPPAFSPNAHPHLH